MGGLVTITGRIEQPWGDERLKLNGRFIGCVTKENADYIMELQRVVGTLCTALEDIAEGISLDPEMVARAALRGLQDVRP